MSEEMEIKLRVPPNIMFELKILRDYYKRNKSGPTTIADLANVALQEYLEKKKEDLQKAKQYYKKMLEE